MKSGGVADEIKQTEYVKVKSFESVLDDVNVQYFSILVLLDLIAGSYFNDASVSFMSVIESCL